MGVRPRTESTIPWLLSFFRPYRTTVGTLASLSLAEIGLRALTPWPLKVIVDALVAPRHQSASVLARLVGPSTPLRFVLSIAMVGLLLQLSHELVMMLHTRVQSRLAQRLVFDLRSRLFTHLQYLSLTYHGHGSTADAVFRLDSDAGCLENLLLKGMFPMVFSALTLVVMFGILLRLDVVLALASMVIVPALYLGLRAYMNRMRPRADRARQLESAVVERLYESLAAIRLVKTFAREEHELTRFSGVAHEAIRERLAVTDRESWFSFLVAALTAAGAALVLGIGAAHVLDGRLTVGTLLMIVAYLGFVYGPLSAIATTTGSLQNALASARRVREVLNLPREAQGDALALNPGRLRGRVQFEHVSFAYDEGRAVLNDISFTAEPGETIALVGLSGAGKSTLVSLLGRMYEPSSGRVLIDGLDIRELALRGLREQVAVVLQESLLFSGTVAANIRYGRLDASDWEVAHAARAAHAHEFIAEMAEGFATSLGESGAGLSGGQRQRISIARAFLKDAPILILDEPTASLDTVAEQAVLAALKDLRKGRTTFVIAHRLSTVRDADRILVLDRGRIIGEGTHEALVSSNVLYRRLCAQLAGPTLPEAESA